MRQPFDQLHIKLSAGRFLQSIRHGLPGGKRALHHPALTELVDHQWINRPAKLWRISEFRIGIDSDQGDRAGERLPVSAVGGQANGVALVKGAKQRAIRQDGAIRRVGRIVETAALKNIKIRNLLCVTRQSIGECVANEKIDK